MSSLRFACVFERFPSFTQTFCAREVLELQRQGCRPLVFSIRDPREESVRHFPESLTNSVICLPPAPRLTAEVMEMKERGLLPPAMVLTFRHWGDRPDKARLYEAAWIGRRLKEAGLRHVHCHFAGLAARTCWWLRQFTGCSYSFTGHANDLFCPQESAAISLGRLVHDASAVVVVSDYTARWLRERYPADAGRIHRVYNGLNLDPVIAAARGAAKGDPPLIASVGRLIDKKGFDDLITACGILRARGHRFRCVIAGDGPEEEALRQQIASLNLADVVDLAGPLPQPEIHRLLGRATVFALACATGRDGGMDVLPTVIMEAMAAGLPVVSTRLAGVPEMVQDGRTGLLTPERQPDAFAAALDRLLSSPDEATRMGEAGRELAQQKFAVTATVRRLRRVLTSRGKLRPDLTLPAETLQQTLRRFTRTLRAPRHSRSSAVFPPPEPAI